MKTLANTLVTVQEISRKLDVGMALENMRGEFFYFNDRWPGNGNTPMDTSRSGTTELFSPDLLKAIEESETEILNKKLTIDYVVENPQDEEPAVRVVLKFIINGAMGTPFCFCTLAKQIEKKDELNGFIKKVKEIFKIESDPKPTGHIEQNH